MEKKRGVKRALLFSLLVLFLYLSILAGATFAWFTDSTMSEVNTIRAGNLKVDLVDADGDTLVGRKLMFKDQLYCHIARW